MTALPRLTFLRFLGFLAGASEPVAEGALSVGGEPLLEGLDLSRLLPRSALLGVVAWPAAEPLDLMVSSVINSPGAAGCTVFSSAWT